jgi:hypothetical protein
MVFSVLWLVVRNQDIQGAIGNGLPKGLAIVLRPERRPNL